MPSRSPAYWLVKSEPEAFSFADLWKARKRTTMWDGVRNYQARNFLRDRMAVGDGVLFYHSSQEPIGVAGFARVASPPYPDPTQFDPESEHFDSASRREAPAWYLVDLQAECAARRCVPLSALRADPRLAKMELLRRGSRLSVQPVTEAEWLAVRDLAGLPEPLGGRPGR